MNNPFAQTKFPPSFLRGRSRLKTRILPQNGEGAVCPMVLIEGDALSLEYFARLVLAQAGFLADCGFSISPSGPGTKFFDNDSQAGLYIHRLPCINKRGCP